MRALNYNIKPIDQFETKRIAGKIIPAISTTTSLVSGLVVIELLKIIQKRKIEDYNNTYINLALPFIGLSEPVSIKKTKLGNYEYSMWDNLKYNDQELQNIIELLKIKIGNFDILSITTGQYVFINSFMNQKQKNERLKTKISNLYKKVYNTNELPNSILLSVEYDIEDTEPIIVKIIFT